ncbi:MAG TPA: BtpA/SgcQ family protein [Clostridiaceae bacterium]|jgi:membrane complex biogenesis BtpA family protein|nr:BtpA/SgcQ family protein [Clostridiaceae bacterium]
MMETNGKDIIGMVHLKALPTAPNHALDLDVIYKAALADLKALEAGGITCAIVENMFDTPYTHEPALDTLISMTVLLTQLKAQTKMTLGLNIQATDGVEEMLVASYAGADFIRAESFVETRLTGGGVIRPMAPALMREKKRLQSPVRVLADINVKHSNPLIEQSIDDLIHEAIASGADGIILTGLATGNAPTVNDAKHFKTVCGSIPLYIGSGVNADNVADLLTYADGTIVGSSIKREGKVDLPVDAARVRQLIKAVLD